MKLCIILLAAFVCVTAAFFTGTVFARSDDQVILTSKPFTENYILTEMMVELLENDTDLSIVNMAIEGGTTSVLHPAMVAGEIDIYPEYTGTGWLEVLRHDEVIPDPEELFDRVAKEYLERFDLVWLPSFGFNNTFTLAVRQEDAERLELETYSDLAAVSDQMVFGSEPDFYEREDGYPGLVEAYGFEFRQTSQMAIALKYPAISQGEVDVINAFSTDGLLKTHELVILEDDKNYFPSYLAAPIVRKEILDAYPEVGESLSRLEWLITEETMMELNYQVDELRRDPREVARDFLVEQGLIQ